MRERITFVHRLNASFNHGQVRVDGDSLLVQSLVASRQDRLTFALQELPPELHNADYLDLDYDATSQTLVLTSFWHAPAPMSEAWTERITHFAGRAKVEVGVLANEQAVEVEELSMGGYLVVIGEEKQLNNGNLFFASFGFPTGLHPNLQISLSHTRMKTVQPSCALHAYLTLPSSVFLDKYQLSSANFLKSVNLHSIRALSGETDLEAPDWSVSKWGSTVLLELAPPKHDSNREGVWHATLPLHFRYLSPTAEAVNQVEIPWPTVFWACPAGEGAEMSVNPFDRANLGYDGLFGPRTIFYHLQPKLSGNDSLVERLEVPVLELSSLERIENETMTVVLVGVLWIIWKLIKIFRKP
ncbi:MAG: hypothetical protein Q9167_004951 [Letrouitia subvulpina]